MARSEAKQTYAERAIASMEHMRNEIKKDRERAEAAQREAKQKEELAAGFNQRADDTFQLLKETEEAFADWEAKNPE